MNCQNKKKGNTDQMVLENLFDKFANSRFSMLRHFAATSMLTKPETLGKLTYDIDKPTRMHAIINSNTPSNYIIEASKSDNLETRTFVSLRLTMRKEVPVEALDNLSDTPTGEDFGIKSRVIDAPNVTMNILNKLRRDPKTAELARLKQLKLLKMI